MHLFSVSDHNRKKNWPASSTKPHILEAVSVWPNVHFLTSDTGAALWKNRCQSAGYTMEACKKTGSKSQNPKVRHEVGGCSGFNCKHSSNWSIPLTLVFSSPSPSLPFSTYRVLYCTMSSHPISGVMCVESWRNNPLLP